MKATGVILNRIGGPLEVSDLELETPRRGEVQVRIEAAGICRTDLHSMEGTFPSPVPTVPVAFPLTKIDDAIATLECGDAGRVVLIPEHN